MGRAFDTLDLASFDLRYELFIWTAQESVWNQICEFVLSSSSTKSSTPKHYDGIKGKMKLIISFKFSFTLFNLVLIQGWEYFKFERKFASESNWASAIKSTKESQWIIFFSYENSYVGHDKKKLKSWNISKKNLPLMTKILHLCSGS